MYNLLDERWIPVLYSNAVTAKVGILQLFKDANNIRQIASSNPMDRVAIFRFLLAVLYWCEGNPPENKDSIKEFSEKLFSKLNENRDCFNLLGDGKRFYQDKETRRNRAVTDLIQEIPAGNNFWHFKHSIDKISGLCLPCCTIGLLRLPLFSVSGLSGPKEPNMMAGINGVPPIYAIPLGESLKETLLLNWIQFINVGEPSWINHDCNLSSEEIPLLQGLTLLSRRVWFNEPEENGICLNCGAKGVTIIKTIEFQTAGKQENENWRDPHVLYKQGKKIRALRAENLMKTDNFKMDRPWNNILSHFIETGVKQKLLIVGYAIRDAIGIDVWERTFSIPERKLIHENSYQLSQLWKDDISKYRLKKAMRGERKQRKDDMLIAASAYTSIRPHVENNVSANIKMLITGGNEEWEKAADEYKPMMSVIAKALSPGYTTAAIKRRKEIAAIKPILNMELDNDKKTNRKKGEK